MGTNFVDKVLIILKNIDYNQEIYICLLFKRYEIVLLKKYNIVIVDNWYILL